MNIEQHYRIQNIVRSCIVLQKTWQETLKEIEEEFDVSKKTKIVIKEMYEFDKVFTDWAVEDLKHMEKILDQKTIELVEYENSIKNLKAVIKNSTKGTVLFS